jgi:hypothetical protein
MAKSFWLLTFHNLASNYGGPRAKMFLVLQSLAPNFGFLKLDDELCKIDSFFALKPP